MTTRHTEKWKGDEWPAGVHEWFQRKVIVSLLDYCDLENSPGWFRLALKEQEIFDWVVRWYIDRLKEFCFNADPDVIWVSNYENDEQRIGYDEQRISDNACKAVRLAQKALAGPREAKTYTNLDSWLEALHAGKLEWSGPSEPNGYTMVAHTRSFHTAAQIRQRNWPRKCKRCGEAFTPDRANARHCPDCLAKRRGTSYRRDCIDCGEHFDAHHVRVTRCPPCRTEALGRPCDRCGKKFIRYYWHDTRCGACRADTP